MLAYDSSKDLEQSSHDYEPRRPCEISTVATHEINAEQAGQHGLAIPLRSIAAGELGRYTDLRF
jgi:hypothetical protein